ncbi:hypothetical protein [Actinomadura formosensis]|uniref:hypothetical protein n=1 Tax=Actinomadura formosensis TaxID=60706 RepID=UPI00104149FF|nr:hypothetical protein [Actinomadura formosensis]
MQTIHDLRDKLRELRDRSGLSYSQIETKSKKAGTVLARATANGMVTGNSAIRKETLSSFVLACGVSEEDRLEWIQAWERVKVRQGQHPATSGLVSDAEVPPEATDPLPGGIGSGASGTPSSSPPPSKPSAGLIRWKKPNWRSRPAAIAVTATLITAAGVTMALWPDGQCGGQKTLRWTGQQCVGVAVPQGTDDLGVFGSKLEPVMKLIGKQNDAATKGGPGSYATVAFMAPLTTTDPDLPPDPRTVSEVQGAYIAQKKANDEPNKRPKIRLVLANQGAGEAHWEDAVQPLEKMADPHGPDHLLAVTGLGLSQDETKKATQWLAKRDIPMVGDIITADRFTKIANGAEPGKGMCLARVAISNTQQLNAIAKQLKPAPATAALVGVSNTIAGTADSYASSLTAFFEQHHRHQRLKPYPYDPRGGSQALDTTAQQLGKTNLVYFSGRAKNLKDFLRALHNRPERATPITVVTGSDGALLQRSASPDLYSGHPPVLGDPAAPIKVLYTPLADPTQLKAHPSQNLYEDFETAYTKAPFPRSDLDTGWAITAHDAVLTATTAIRKAIENATTPHALPNLFGVCNQLGLLKDAGINGASGYFSIDPNTGDRIDRQLPPQPVTLPLPR